MSEPKAAADDVLYVIDDDVDDDVEAEELEYAIVRERYLAHVRELLEEEAAAWQFCES